MEKIVVAIDGSETSRSLVDYALHFAAKEKNVVLLFVHVIESQEHKKFSFHGLTVDVLPRQEEVKANFVKFIEDEIAVSDFGKPDMSLHVTNGIPYDQIVRFAKEKDADMIMIGHRGLNDLETFFLGSVASKVVGHAPCSVYVHKNRNSD